MIMSEACMNFPFNTTDRFSLLSSLLQTSRASVPSEDSNSLLSEVRPNKWHFNRNTPLSLKLCLTHCFSGLSPSYGSCCLWSALLCCRIRPPPSPTLMTVSRDLLVRAVFFQHHRALLRPQNQSLLPTKRHRLGPSTKGLQLKGVWTWYTETWPQGCCVIYIHIHYIRYRNNSRREMKTKINNKTKTLISCIHYQFKLRLFKSVNNLITGSNLWKYTDLYLPIHR